MAKKMNVKKNEKERLFNQTTNPASHPVPSYQS